MDPQEAVARIARLRQDIARIDEQVLALVSWRMKVAEEIGECKRVANRPVRDFHAEVEVLERTRRACQQIGLDPEVGSSLIQVLIEGAVRTQHGLAVQSYAGSRRQVLVVGGCGRMGAWLAHFFASQGHRVVIHDQSGRRLPGFRNVRGLRRAVEQADIVVLATPLEETARVLDAVAAAHPPGLVFDICSLKTPLAAAVERGIEAGLRIASVHPLFAPDTVLLSGRIMVVCDCGHAEAAAQARALFEDTALRLVDVPFAEHDRLMAYVLGLSHAVNIAFASVLAESGLSPYDLDRVASTTFAKQTRTAREVAHENPRLYYEIQHGNRCTAAVLGALADAVGSLREAALADDADGFARLMERNRIWFESPGDLR